MKRILLLAAVLLIVALSVWLIWSGSSAVQINIPTGSRLKLYAVSYGTNSQMFPARNPLKRIPAEIRMKLPFRNKPMHLQSNTAVYLWIADDQQPSYSQSIGPQWHAVVEGAAKSGNGMCWTYGPGGTVGVYCDFCPTNCSTLTVAFYRGSSQGSSEPTNSDDFVGRVTVRNPAYR